MNHLSKIIVSKRTLLALSVVGFLGACAKPSGLSEPVEPMVLEDPVAIEIADSTQQKEKTAQAAESLACSRLADFETSAENNEWVVVNDNIMGGRSLGGPEFDDSVMTFSGYINTNGGGFSSVRKPLMPSVLDDYNRIVMRVKPDGRAYRLILEDELETRSRPTVHRKNIEFGLVGEWQIVSVSFEQLQPSVFGDPVEAPRFRPDLASRIGLMLNDVGDGAFQLEVDWVDACR